MQCLIFSKNRPAQLDLCLRSHERFWGEEIKVLYTCDKEYKKGYEKVKKRHPKVKFELETDFRKQVIDNLKGEYTVYDCDDDVMIRPFTEDCPEFKEFAENEDIAGISLRMARNYDYCFDSDVEVKLPRFIDGMWEWRKYPFDWGLSMSVLLHIFRTEDLKGLLPQLNFHSPNSFESAMAENPIQRDLMIGFDKAKCVDLPMNLIQTEAKFNRTASIDPKELNKKFMQGFEIDLDDIIKKTKDLRSCFCFVDYVWRKQ